MPHIDVKKFRGGWHIYCPSLWDAGVAAVVAGQKTMAVHPVHPFSEDRFGYIVVNTEALANEIAALAEDENQWQAIGAGIQ